MTSIVHLAPPQARIVQAWRIDPAWVKRGVRAVYLPTMVVTPSGSFAYSARVGAARAIKTATANHPNASPLSTACGFFVVANLASTTPDALVIGRLRYNGSANFGAGLRFRQHTLEMNMGAGTGSWAYSDFNSGSVLTGRHSYAVKCVNSASAGWRDGVSLTPISTIDSISISGLDSGNVDIGQSTASGGTAVTAAVDGVIEIGMVLAPFAMTNDVIRLLHANPWRVLLPLAVEQPESTGGAYTLTAEQGSYTLTGQAAGLLAGRVLAAAQGSYTLTGQDVALLKGTTLTADQGSYALTCQDVALLRGLLLSAAQGSYALTGQDATLTYTPLGAFSLTADQGNYTLTGQSASLLWGPVLAAGQGSYTLNGQDATLTYTPVGAYILTAGHGSYALTGQDVLLQWGHVLAAAQGSYTLTGQAATLARGLVLAATQGSYTLNGQAAAFRRTYVLSAGYGSYALTGQIVSLTYSGAALEALEYLLLISHITQSMSKTSKVTMEVDLISRIQQQLDGSSSI